LTTHIVATSGVADGAVVEPNKAQPLLDGAVAKYGKVQWTTVVGTPDRVQVT
jgi:hypothetical protein